jgi:hypothetical protein
MRAADVASPLRQGADALDGDSLDLDQLRPRAPAGDDVHRSLANVQGLGQRRDQRLVRRPSTGGAARRTFSAPAWTPPKPGCAARGWTRTRKRTRFTPC